MCTLHWRAIISSGMCDKTVRGNMKCFLSANLPLADKTSELPTMTWMTGYSKEGMWCRVLGVIR